MGCACMKESESENNNDDQIKRVHKTNSEGKSISEFRPVNVPNNPQRAKPFSIEIDDNIINKEIIRSPLNQRRNLVRNQNKRENPSVTENLRNSMRSEMIPLAIQTEPYMISRMDPAFNFPEMCK